MREVEIVVARLNEDMGWIQNSTHPVIVYDKSIYRNTDCRPTREQHIEYVPIEPDDFGWCASTWLKHIIREYDDLANCTVFLQGSQKDHNVDINHIPIDLSKGFGWLGNMPMSTSSDGSPHSFPEIKPVFERVFGKPCPAKFEFVHGYQFWVRRDVIHRKPKVWYQYVLYFYTYLGWETKTQWRSHLERYWDYIVSERTFQ